MIAYRNDPGVRDEIIARVKSAIEKQAFDKEAGPLVSITGTADEAVFVENSGYPLSLVKLITPFFFVLPEIDAASHVLSWLESTVPGADLKKVSEYLVVDALEDTKMLRHFTGQPEASSVHTQLLSLHLAAANGQASEKQLWRATRKAAVALVETAKEPQKDAFRLLEVAAWPVSSAPELLFDLFWAETSARQADLLVSVDLPPQQEGDDEIYDRIIEEKLAEGMPENEIYDQLDAFLAERRPDITERNRILREIEAVVSQEVALTVSSRIRHRLATAQASH